MSTEVPVYRPEVTLYRRDPDGVWEAAHGGTMTNTLFRPMPDEDAPTEAGFRRVVRLGTEPFFRVVVPEGAALVEKGRALFLQLPGGKSFDAITTLAYAKMREFGLDLVRPGRGPAPPSPRYRDAITSQTPPPPPPPAPAGPRGPVRQLSMFGEEAVH